MTSEKTIINRTITRDLTTAVTMRTWITFFKIKRLKNQAYSYWRDVIKVLRDAKQVLLELRRGKVVIQAD